MTENEIEAIRVALAAFRSRKPEVTVGVYTAKPVNDLLEALEMLIGGPQQFQCPRAWTPPMYYQEQPCRMCGELKRYHRSVRRETHTAGPRSGAAEATKR